MLPARGTLIALLILSLAACGGSSNQAPGGGSGGGGGGNGSAGAPSGAFLAPQLGAAGMLGDTIAVRFVADDDGEATVRIVADADRDLATQGDQTVLFQGIDANGVAQDTTLVLAAPLTAGAHALVLQIDDGVNPLVEVALPFPLIVYRGIAGVAPPRSNRYGVANGVVIFSRGEAEDAAGVLNGDADATDGVMVALQVGTGIMTQPVPSPSMDVTPFAGGVARVLRAEGGTLTWVTNEADEGVNLNATNVQNATRPFVADVDQTDQMLSYIVPGTSLTPRTNTYGGATQIVGRVDGRVVAFFAEAGEGTGAGGGTDLNADGDAADSMMGYLDPSVGAGPFEFNQMVFYNVPAAAAAGPDFRHAGQQACGFLTSEVGSAAGTDFNADGDGLDTFLFLGNLLTAGGAGAPGMIATLAGTPNVGPPMPVDPGGAFDVTLDLRAGYYADEAAAGAGGTDLNGDLVLGFVPAFYDTNTLTQTIPASTTGPLNAPAGSATMIYDVTRLFFTVQEGPRVDPGLGTNGDNDGGADLAILYWVDHAAAQVVAQPVAVNFGGALTLQALSLDGGGSATQLAPGWIALLVSEAANGNQDINGSGVVDMAYLLLETGAGPAPVVHNPNLVPSTAGTFPMAGIYLESPQAGDEGVVLRLTEAANGILDGDGNATETFLAYISFRTPTNTSILDAGGDHCAVANGMIGVTANEALTGVDYDGNGSMQDHVFRVLDRTGAVREKGRLCSTLSVPATETGQVWAFLRDEAVEGRDMNGDNDTVDQILGIWLP